MKTAGQDRKAPQRREPMILFGVGDNMFAISATAVDEIRANQGLNQIERAVLPKVRYKLARDRRTYYVVDGCAYFGKSPSLATRILVLRNSRVAVLVSYIDRMTEIGDVVRLPQAFSGEERNWYRGLTVLDSGGDNPVVIPVVNAEGFITGSEMAILQSQEALEERSTRTK